MVTILLGPELLEEFKKGKREFTDIKMDYPELSNQNLRGIIIRNSSFRFPMFRFSDLTGCKFVNCDILFGGFRGANLTDAVFENCKIEYSFFGDATLRNTKMLKCEISWTGFLDTNIRELDMSSSTQFKVFSDPSQITQQDVDTAISNIGPIVEKLDFSIRQRVQSQMRYGVERVKKQISSPTPAQYGKTEGDYKKPANVYQQFSHLIEGIVQVYGTKNTYQTKRKKPDPYGQNGKKM